MSEMRSLSLPPSLITIINQDHEQKGSMMEAELKSRQTAEVEAIHSSPSSTDRSST